MATDLLIQQHNHWVKLHSFRLLKWDSSIATEWFIQWQRDIPDIDCGCMVHWRGLIRRFPADLSSAEAFFAWGVEAHNRVNKRIGKKLFTIKEAKTQWQS
jgi:hypothetical protein